MFNSLRLTFLLVLLLVVSWTPALLQPQWARNLGVEPRTGTTLHNLWTQLTDDPPTAPPDDALRVLQWRSAVKYRLTRDVIAGRLSLFEAAARFRRLNKVNPVDELIGYWGDSQEDRLCQEVMQWVSVALQREDPDNRADCCKRLEEELRRHKEQFGKVLLPADDSVDDDTNDLYHPSHHPAWRGGHDQ